MSTVSTFGTFTTARLGIYVSQKALDVVGNNIANINTVGYTRQSFNQRSMYVGSADRYRTMMDTRVGNGAIITNITQLRDPYLDIRYRNEQSSVGAMSAKLNGLQQLADILDEVGKGEEGEGVLEAQFNDLISKIQDLNTDGAGLDTYDTQVRSSAKALVDKFHSYADQLETLWDNQRKAFDQDIDNVNTILEGIRNLSESIRNSNIYGGDALEQKDERNNLIDELSQYMRIDVTYEMEDIGEGKKIEKLVIKLAGNSAKEGREINNATLVDGIYATQLSIRQQPVQELDEDGKPKVDDKGNPVYATNEKGETLMEDDPYLRIDLDALKDSEGRLMRSRKTRTEVMADANVAKKVQEAVDKAAADGLTGDDADKAIREALQNLIKNDPKLFPKEEAGTGKLEKYTYNVAKDKDGNWSIVQTTETFSQGVSLEDNTLYGALQSERELLTEQGEYATKEQMDMDVNASNKRGIRYYQKALDTLANQFANAMNEANRVEGALDVNALNPNADIPAVSVFKLKDGTYAEFVTKTVTDPNTNKEIKMFDVTDTTCQMYNADMPDRADYADDAAYKTAFADWLKKPGVQESIIQEDGMMTKVQKEHLIPASDGGRGHGQLKEVPADKVPAKADNILFSNDGDGNTAEGITASNISVSKDWADGVVRIQQSKNPNHTSTDNSNLSHFLNLIQAKHDFKPNGADLNVNSHLQPEGDTDETDDIFFSGTFQEFFTENMVGTLANDYMTTETMLNNYSTTADELYVERDSVSGVDLNDEAMNMIQYQKSYSAACRLMTTIDEMLDKLINGTGRVGL